MKNFKSLIISVIFIFCYVFSFTLPCSVRVYCEVGDPISCMGDYCVSEGGAWVACYTEDIVPPYEGEWVVFVCDGYNASEVLEGLPEDPI